MQSNLMIVQALKSPRVKSSVSLEFDDTNNLQICVEIFAQVNFSAAYIR